MVNVVRDTECLEIFEHLFEMNSAWLREIGDGIWGMLFERFAFFIFMVIKLKRIALEALSAICRQGVEMLAIVCSKLTTKAGDRVFVADTVDVDHDVFITLFFFSQARPSSETFHGFQSLFVAQGSILFSAVGATAEFASGASS